MCSSSFIANDPQRAGQLATAKEFFGEFSRFCVAAVYTRFDSVQWFVWDSENQDRFGLPAVIGQYETKEQAICSLSL